MKPGVIPNVFALWETFEKLAYHILTNDVLTLLPNPASQVLFRTDYETNRFVQPVVALLADRGTRGKIPAYRVASSYFYVFFKPLISLDAGGIERMGQKRE